MSQRNRPRLLRYLRNAHNPCGGLRRKLNGQERIFATQTQLNRPGDRLDLRFRNRCVSERSKYPLARLPLDIAIGLNQLEYP
jgi:hypothetical protein